MRAWRLRIAALVGVALIVAVAVLSCGKFGGGPRGAGGPGSAASAVAAATPVSVITAMRGPIRDIIRVTGTVVALREVDVVPEASGRVLSVHADVGDRVTKGSLLLRFDTDLMATQARQAEAGVELAKARLMQAKDTASLTGQTTGITVEQAEKQVEQARTQLAKAETAAQTTETTVNNNIAQAQLAVQSAETQLAEVRRGAREQVKKQAEAQVQIAQAGYDFAKSQYDVKKRLYTQGAASGTEYGQALAELQSARSALEQARQNLDLVKEGPTTEQVRLAELQLERAKEQLRLAEAQRSQIDLAREDVELSRTQVRLAEDQLAMARAAKGEVKVRQGDIEAAKAGVTQAAAQRDYAYTTLRKHSVYAPISGLVALRLTDPGESAGPTKSVFRLVDISSVYVEAVLSESDVERVEKGQEATVIVKGLKDAEFRGTVYDISPSAIPGQRNFIARVLVKNTGEILRPGMSAEVSLIVGENASAVLVPRDAIVEDREKRLVYAVENGQVRIRPVKLGVEERGTVEVVSGVKAGDLLVVAGQSSLAEGQKVEPVQREVSSY
ncbi:MAG: efflux RND transporter periplasmic adaptor subunit [Candidatus Zipacnadales bacterium]